MTHWIGVEYVPEISERELIDEIIQITNEDAGTTAGRAVIEKGCLLQPRSMRLEGGA